MESEQSLSLGLRRDAPVCSAGQNAPKSPGSLFRKLRGEAAAGRAVSGLDAFVNHTAFLAQCSLWLSQERSGIPNASGFI